jgi:DNA recombination protein RmuC
MDDQTKFYLLLALTALVSLLIGWLVSRLRAQRRLAELETRLRLCQETSQTEKSLLETTFGSLSLQALEKNNRAFLQLAEQTLQRFQEKAKGELSEKEKAVENLVKPIKDALEKTEAQIRIMENERKEAYGSLHKHLETMAVTQQQLQGETRNLVQALRRPEVRGQWGEMTLKRLAELAGMVEHCDFYEQEQVQSESGALRPDMIVRMPDRREIVVDAKTPLDAYLNAVEAKDDESRNQYLQHHAQNVRKHIRQLASKAYWNQFEHAPEFVILFIPGDQFLAAALDQDRALLEDALKEQIILTTPTSLVALLRAVAYGWRQESLAENAELIRDAGVELYQRLATFSEHLARVGKGLDSATANYNKAVGSFEAKVVPGARKFTELGVSPGKQLENTDQVERGVRSLSDQDKS